MPTKYHHFVHFCNDNECHHFDNLNFDHINNGPVTDIFDDHIILDNIDHFVIDHYVLGPAAARIASDDNPSGLDYFDQHFVDYHAALHDEYASKFVHHHHSPDSHNYILVHHHDGATDHDHRTDAFYDDGDINYLLFWRADHHH